MKAKILGKLRGIIASAREKSRNGRLYNEGFWDKKFNSELFQEGIKNRVFLGQCYHPDDEEVYSQIHLDDTAAIVLTDVKKQGLDYIGTFDILPTQAGQCVRNLLDVGVTFGISSRGLADRDAEVFDESMADNYDLITFDLVAFPGLKSCRLKEIGSVSESLNKSKRTKEQIMENLNELTKNSDQMKKYVQNALKLKEDFDRNVTVEDVMNKYNIPDDLTTYAKIVAFNENAVPYYNDGEHGKHEVILPKKYEVAFNPYDIVLVDNIFWDKSKYKYITNGSWLKLDY